MGALVNVKLNMSKQYAPAAQKVKCFLVCFNRYMASRVRKLILSLYSALLRHYLEYCVQLWDPQHKENVNLGASPEDGHKNDQRNRTSLQREKAERVEAVHVEKKKLWGDLQAAFQYSNGAYRREKEVRFAKLGQRVMALI